MGSITSYVSQAISYVCSFLQTYGWHIVFTLIFLYLAGPYIRNAYDAANLAHANREPRKSALDKERRRIRELQQKEAGGNK